MTGEADSSADSEETEKTLTVTISPIGAVMPPIDGFHDMIDLGIDFPKSKAALVLYARHNLDNRKKGEYTSATEVLKVLEKLPSRKYSNMADVEYEVGRLK